jgi:hypothetical protein
MADDDELQGPWSAKLDPRDAGALAAAVREVRDERRAALQQAIDAALEHVPRLLRGAMRKVLF